MNLQLKELSELIQKLNALGHSPATSGNYSFFDREAGIIYVSESGIDKENFTYDNWVGLDPRGEILSDYKHKKCSAETALHLAIYKNTSATCVLHSHHMSFANYRSHQVSFVGEEIIKAIKGFHSHEQALELPIYPNTQDIETLSNTLEFKNYGFVLRSHGLTVWGESILEAKRHLEAYTYLFQLKEK